MKFNVSSATLCNRLQTLSRVLASKNSIQILDCILFELQDGKLRLTASDSETTLVSTLDVDEADSNGMFAIKAATIINGLKEISDQPITLDVNPETHEIVIYYQNGRSSFVGQGGEEYPSYPSISDSAQQLTIDANVLLNGISRAIFATAEDEIRPVMNGVFFDFHDSWRATSFFHSAKEACKDLEGHLGKGKWRCHREVRRPQCTC